MTNAASGRIDRRSENVEFLNTLFQEIVFNANRPAHSRNKHGISIRLGPNLRKDRTRCEAIEFQIQDMFLC